MRFTDTEEQAILRSVDGLLPNEALAGLRAAYSAPDRHYHDWTHALSVLSWVNHVCDVFGEAQLAPFTHRDLRLAALYHDAVYTMQDSPFNEADSAELLVHSVGAGAHRATRIIMATAEHGRTESEGTPLAVQLFMDCDIATFGEARWEVAKWNDQNVVAELLLRYTPEQVAEGRRAFLTGMLDKRSIFLSDYFRTRWEAQARRNIGRFLLETQP
jgi:predicted metal-dependent HD superfamily phosphohydrolase